MEVHGEKQEKGAQGHEGVAIGLRPLDSKDVPRAWTLDGQRIAIEVDLSIYSSRAILRAAYKFTDRCYVFLGPADRAGALHVVLAPKKPQAPDLMEALVGEFANEAIDQRLRESLADEFGAVQKLIAVQAFAEGNLLDAERDDGDYRADPKGISRRR